MALDTIQSSGYNNPLQVREGRRETLECRSTNGNPAPVSRTPYMLHTRCHTSQTQTLPQEIAWFLGDSQLEGSQANHSKLGVGAERASARANSAEYSRPEDSLPDLRERSPRPGTGLGVVAACSMVTRALPGEGGRWTAVSRLTLTPNRSQHGQVPPRSWSWSRSWSRCWSSYKFMCPPADGAVQCAARGAGPPGGGGECQGEA